MSRCKHLNRRNIFGDEIIRTVDRQRCTDCGRVVRNTAADAKGLSEQTFQDTNTLLSLIDELLDEMVESEHDDGTF